MNNSQLPVFLDEGADEVLLSIAGRPTASSPGARGRTPKILVPHCNCRASNEAYLGAKISWGQDPQGTYQMVPTQSKDTETCDFCGYFAFMHERRLVLFKDGKYR